MWVVHYVVLYQSWILDTQGDSLICRDWFDWYRIGEGWSLSVLRVLFLYVVALTARMIWWRIDCGKDNEFPCRFQKGWERATCPSGQLGLARIRTRATSTGGPRRAEKCVEGSIVWVKENKNGIKVKVIRQSTLPIIISTFIHLSIYLFVYIYFLNNGVGLISFLNQPCSVTNASFLYCINVLSVL